MRAASGAWRCRACGRSRAPAAGAGTLRHWDCPRASSLRRAADGRDLEGRSFVRMVVTSSWSYRATRPATFHPAPNARWLRTGVRAPTGTARDSGVGDRRSGTAGDACIAPTRPSTGSSRTASALAVPDPRPRFPSYFEYNSTTSCSCAAIGMLPRCGRSSMRPLNDLAVDREPRDRRTARRLIHAL